MAIDLDGRFLQALLDRTLRLEDIGELFESLVCRLNEEEEDSNHLDHDPADVDEIEFPADGFDSDRDAVGVDYHGDVEEQEV